MAAVASLALGLGCGALRSLAAASSPPWPARPAAWPPTPQDPFMSMPAASTAAPAGVGIQPTSPLAGARPEWRGSRRGSWPRCGPCWPNRPARWRPSAPPPSSSGATAPFWRAMASPPPWCPTHLPESTTGGGGSPVAASPVPVCRVVARGQPKGAAHVPRSLRIRSRPGSLQVGANRRRWRGRISKAMGETCRSRGRKTSGNNRM